MILKNKTALITGANRGIGFATVALFAQEGCNIYACVRKQDAKFEESLTDLSNQYGVTIKPLYFELTDYDAVKVCIKRIISDKVGIDILVNCAGISMGGHLVMTTMNNLKNVFEVNFFAQINLIQVVAKSMMRKKSGSIVNVTSVRGLHPISGSLAYASSKASLICSTKVIAKDLAPYGIRVNAVAPGTTDTDMGNNRSKDELDHLISMSSMKRLATPEEIAESILFLSSDNASFITGEVLVVDGGL